MRISDWSSDVCSSDLFTVRAGAAPTNTRGRPVLSSVRWHRVNAAGQAQAGEGGDIACDARLVSGGWNPTVHLLSPSGGGLRFDERSEEHTSELQSLMRISYAVFCLKKKHTKK